MNEYSKFERFQREKFKQTHIRVYILVRYARSRGTYYMPINSSGEVSIDIETYKKTIASIA